MAYPSTAQVTPVPIPVGGMNARDSLAQMDPNVATWALNMEPEPQFLKTRPGYVCHALLPSNMDVYCLVAYGRTDLFAFTHSDAANAIYKVTYPSWISGRAYTVGTKVLGSSGHIYNCSDAITTSTTEPVRTSTGTEVDGDGEWTWVENAASSITGTTTDYLGSAAFAKRVAFVSLTDPTHHARVYAGSSWADAGFTYLGTPVCGNWLVSYKGRCYFTDDTYLYYSGTVAGVTGAVLRVAIDHLLDGIGAVSWGATLATPGERTVEEMLVIGTTSGDVVVFGGDNPGATNWEVVGTFKIPPLPANSYARSAVRFRNDVWIATLNGVVSLRALMQYGSDEWDKVSISYPIDPYITKNAYGAGVTAFFDLAFWPEQNKVYALMPGHIDVDGAYSSSYATMFVYNLISKAWTIHKLTQGTAGLTYFNNGIYFYGGGTPAIHKVDTTVFKDATNVLSTRTYAGYAYALHSAYINIGSANSKRVCGFEPIMKTDFTGTSVTMKAAADFGRKVSAASTQALLDGHQTPTYSVGIDGRFIQYRIEGTTDTASADGLELYSMGAVIK